MAHPEPELPLPNGDVTDGIVRVGGTVRRPQGPHSPLVHAVLRHLEQRGFEGAPRFLGIDERGREILTYVEGEVAGRPAPAWLADESRLVSLARLVRRLDNAMAGFAPSSSALEGIAAPDIPGMPPEPDGAPEFIGHLDITPENVVFRDGEAVALIDFDLAKPATHVDEVFNLCLWWAPLMPDEDRPEPLKGVAAVDRTRLVADAYGLSAEGRARFVPTAVRRTERSWHLMKYRAEHDGGGWLRMWQDGVGERIARRLLWLEAEGPKLAEGLRI
ncbi:aminoglycoside phosphotransferase family protein [Sinomonas sp. JGH33]|uniref:Aminoglycoside phosphotransferase family protein n=1 Tax=Sinomonas terricola TaxID=3110330 RepID=A0ABU5T2V4_9MICC|nr:aminoglycoside phosphotransferase family protein [Sinomonas sp. JGH33]MEA5453994.1 aminoglycoside phosphotransferase family protein [Sinomonas sp. JGH33]